MKHTNTSLAPALALFTLLMTDTRALHLEKDGAQIQGTNFLSDTVASASSHTQVASYSQAQVNVEVVTASVEDDISALEEMVPALQALNDDLIEAVAIQEEKQSPLTSFFHGTYFPKSDHECYCFYQGQGLEN